MAISETVPPSRNQRAPQRLQSLSNEQFMKNALIPGRFCFAAMTFALPDDTRGGRPYQSATVSGIVGHVVGHGGMGAVAGCAYGIHRWKSYDREKGSPLSLQQGAETESAAAIAEIRRKKNVELSATATASDVSRPAASFGHVIRSEDANHADGIRIPETN
jgi:hypothetical protein